MYTAHRRKKRL